MFAVVMGVLALALALAGPVRGAVDRGAAAQAGPVRHGAVEPGAVEAGAVTPGPGAGAGARAVFADAVHDRGPSCAPGPGGAGTEPAVPASRAGHEHGSVLVARAVPEGVRPYRAECVRVPVRGAGRRAPGPVELNVMRV
ncbi:hypothetical protein IPZ70_00975 [Streptomyces polychromogenes]|nr:hypothetical protein [Streptomyces polychromogenes]